MKNFTFINFARGPQQFGVHRTGCSDIARTMAGRGPKGTLGNNFWKAKAETLEAAIAEQVADFQADDMGYTAGDFHIYPCATEYDKAPDTTTKYCPTCHEKTFPFTTTREDGASIQVSIPCNCR